MYYYYYHYYFHYYFYLFGSFVCEVVENCVLGLPVFFLDSRTLKVRPTGCTETFVRNYHYALRKSPKERSSYLYLI
jgi:hypothetical protein